MKQLAAALISAPLLAGGPLAEGIQVWPNGSRPSAKGPEAYFTGPVRVDPQFGGAGQSRVTAGHVTFEPGSRAVWHTHPAGQVLIVTFGTGWVQEWGQPKREIRMGDVVWIAPGVKHWHGATDKTGMSHLAITELVDGKNVDWMEKVDDAQFAK